MNCRLCGSETSILWKTGGKEYLFCSRCGFIQALRKYFPDPDKEKKRYLAHNNSASNTGYIAYIRDFLDSAVTPYMRKGSLILDFGSGPVPVLSDIMDSMGYRTVSYDPYFAGSTHWKNQTFDGIVSLEVFEHLQNPVKEMEDITAVLRNGGYIAIGTMLHPEDKSFFDRWWYRNDITHISFYSENTFRIMADMFNLRFVLQKDYSRIILSKPP